MSEPISIEVYDRKTGERRVDLLALPIEIGKAPTAGAQIRLAPDRATISRSHGRIERQGAHFAFVDTSSNGSTVGGERVHRASRHFRQGDVIGIEQYEIRVVAPAALVVRLTDRRLAALGEVRVAAGAVCDLTRDPVSGRLALTLGAAQTSAAAPAILSLAFDGSTVTLSAGTTGEVSDFTVNGTSMNVPGVAAAGTVVGVAGHRIELLEPGRDKVVCGNPACHLLNDPPFEQNCPWCGFHLAASGSFTRVTLP